MRNEQNRWNEPYRSYRQGWEDDNNSEWRPTKYRNWNDSDYNSEPYGYRPGSSYRQDTANYAQGSGYSSNRRQAGYGSYRSRQDLGSDYEDYGNYRGYTKANRAYGRSPYNRSSYEADDNYGSSNRYRAAGYGNRYEGYNSGVGYNRNYHPDATREQYADYRRNQNVYDRDERDFWDKAGDEIASWFGDDEARRRREMDQRAGEQGHYYAGSSYRGKGPKNYKRSDERIQEDVNDRLSDDPHIDASDIDVTVSNSEVILSGTVRDRRAKRHAEDLAEMVSGVRNVENRIRVKNDEYEETTQITSSTSTAS